MSTQPQPPTISSNAPATTDKKPVPKPPKWMKEEEIGKEKQILLKVEEHESRKETIQRLWKTKIVDTFTIPEKTKFATFWVFLCFLATSYNFVTATLRAAVYTYVDHPLWTGIWVIPDVIVDAILLFDFILCFFKRLSGTDGIYIYDTKIIAKNYVKSLFFYTDFLSSIPIDYILLIADLKWGMWARMIRCIRIVRVNDYFSQFEQQVEIISITGIQILRYMFYFFIATHVLACGWYIIVMTDPVQTVRIWTAKATITEDRSLQAAMSRYIRGFNWVLTQMTGYGGTTPVTLSQCIFSQAVNIVGVALVILVIGAVGNILEDSHAEKAKRKQKLDSLKQYMSYRKIPEVIRGKIERYYHFVWKARSGWDETEVLQDLPWYLQSEIYLSMNAELIQKVDLFKVEGANKTFITSMVMALRPQVVLPGTKIVKKGEIGREMYFILKGYVQVVTEDPEPKVLATLDAGKFFGEISVIMDQTRMASVRAGTYCDLYVLTKESLKQIEQDFPLPVQKIREKAIERLNAAKK
ncbi:hypothetical protein C9374_013365 [Naegleria lovaniensis]|uniref:Cyclic nucleotide-binding domain-containing protein n=1 Tax=Naegleria lovaniensis TaxID=51637 RepID=A0AA88GVT6_NAELO|nr:uncharacterized protein C9374_013365 [Naegleria lovaniensis]KAG2391880.1 hypothetical protein C9374_013365 [Naegleria lovaniensis]